MFLTHRFLFPCRKIECLNHSVHIRLFCRQFPGMLLLHIPHIRSKFCWQMRLCHRTGQRTGRLANLLVVEPFVRVQILGHDTKIKPPFPAVKFLARHWYPKFEPLVCRITPQCAIYMQIKHIGVYSGNR